MQATIYRGVWDPYASEPTKIREFLAAFDFADTQRRHFNVTILHNKTAAIDKSFNELLNAGASNFEIPLQERTAAQVSDAITAFVNAIKGADLHLRGSLMGLREMPRPTYTKFELSLDSFFGPLVVSCLLLLLPMMVQTIMYEKENKIRIMMRMMGLTSSTYWLVNWFFWSLMYMTYLGVLDLMTILMRLPNGFRVGWFIQSETTLVLVFFILVSQHTTAFAFLISAVWGSYKGSQKLAFGFSVALYVLLPQIIQQLLEQGGVLLGPNRASNDVQNLLTLLPLVSTYRGVLELLEYVDKGGLTWAKVMDASEGSGMGAVLAILFCQALFFYLLAWYLDQVVDTGYGVPLHPLFFLGFKRMDEKVASDGSIETGSEGGVQAPDVEQERQRVMELLAETSREKYDTIMIDSLAKVYPGQHGQPPKMAVKSLTLGIRAGECFGMLGPNGAGKTTAIHCLIGLVQPSSGNAFVKGHSIRSAMDTIYSLMGVCPQHDLLWEALTARAHMEFYGAIKNLKGDCLRQAVTEGLRQVDLLNWIDSPVSGFSGGMKRRLSVAIALIGSNQVCYLDEPSTGLDPASRRTLWSVIKGAKKRSALMLTTHSMEEAEELCDRLGIFINGALHCVGALKSLSSRFGGYFVLTVTSKPEAVQDVAEVVHAMSAAAKISYALGGTQKFEIPASDVQLSQIFSSMSACKDTLAISDWGIASATLEEGFIRLCTAAGASGI